MSARFSGRSELLVSSQSGVLASLETRISRAFQQNHRGPMDRVSLPISWKACSFIVVLGVFAPVWSWSQVRRPASRSTAIELSDSRAQREADEMVSLSADKIISLLRQETGLLLEVKKALVRKAYEQGRILDPSDLTDDSLFRLLREDESIRVIATREIEDRNYIRVKPTREELEQERLRQSPSGVELPADKLADKGNQEDTYWAKREAEEAAIRAKQAQQQNEAPQPQAPPPAQQYRPRFDPRDNQRDLDRTDIQPFLGGPDAASVGLASMSRVQPGELPALFKNGATDGSNSGALTGQLLGGNLLSGGSFLSGLGSLEDQDSGGFQQEASLDTRRRMSQYPLYPRAPSPTGNPVLRHSPNPYADIPSLYDLYARYSGKPVLHRFGEDIFQNGTGNFDDLPMDMPAGPDYVVGPGDGLNIELWGGISRRLRRFVDREGRLALPEAGLVQVAGRNLGDVQHLVQSVLRSQFRDVEADVSLARLRTVRVYVTGDVQRPGAYDISSLSTPLNAVYAAGGPTSKGSLRIIRHKREEGIVQELDVYDLLLHGVRADMKHMEPGDTIFVPTLGPEITIEGMVRRPAIYELRGEKSLAEALELAGGVLTSGTLRHVDVERIAAHESRTMLRLDVPENNNQQAITKALEDFVVQDGDKVKISPILPYADKTVYLDGHVFRPGKFAYRDGMKVTDLIKSYSDLLPEPYKQHAEIIRLSAPDYTPTVLAFNLGDALAGKDQDLLLKPFDTVRVFGRFDFEDPPVVTVVGEVRDPGDHITNGATYLRDAIYLAGGATPDALLDDAQVFRRTSDGKVQVIGVNLSKALSGDQANNLLLTPKDRLVVHRNLAKADPATVIIQGEVAKPGKYPLGREMTAADLVRAAGGLRRGAFTETADLTRYLVQDGKKITNEHRTVSIAAALAGEPDTDVRLHDGDVLSIGQLTGWKDVGATITVGGEVVHPGTYGIREGERLSSIIERAGGFRADAYPYGAVFERLQVRELEEKSRSQMIRDVSQEGVGLRAAPDNEVKEAALAQWQTTLDRLRNTPPEGRLVVHISKNTKKWANTSTDIQVRAGDSLFIPKRPSIVTVSGSVYNATALTYKPGKSAAWYLRQAGGPTNIANKKGIFIVRADGSVAGGAGGFFDGGATSTELQPGDMVVVPERVFSANSRFKSILEGAQLAYAVGIAIQVARSF